MTKRTFILTGLFLIFSSSLLMALETYLVLSGVMIQDAGLYIALFRFPVIPLIFCFLLWRRLRHVGRSRLITVFSMAGFVVLFFTGFIGLTPFFTIIAELNPSNIVNEELAAWVKAGKKGTFQISTQSKLILMGFNASTLILVSWPLFVALFFGALDPRSPGGANPFVRLSKRVRKMKGSGQNVRAQMVA